MQDPTQPAVEIGVGETKLQLLFDFEAVAEAEDLLDRPIITGVQRRDIRQPKISLVRAMFFAGLRRKQPEMSFEEASALVTVRTLRPIWEAVLSAYGQFCADPEEGDEPNPQPAQT